MKDTQTHRASLSLLRSGSGAFRAGDIRTGLPAQSFQDSEDDHNCGIRMKRFTSSQTSFEHPMTETHSVRKRSLGQRLSSISTPPAQYHQHQESCMPSLSHAQSGPSHASAIGAPILGPDIVFNSGQAPQGLGKAFGGRKRNLLKTAVRSLLGQKPNSEIPLDKPILEANLPRQRNGPVDVGTSSMAVTPSATLRRSASSPTLMHGSRQVWEPQSPVGSLDSVLQRKRVKPVPSTPQLRSTLLESVFEAPNESSARPASPPGRSASLNHYRPISSGQARQIRPPVNRDYKLKQQSTSMDPLFQITEAYRGSMRHPPNADKELGEHSSTETDVLGPLDAIEGLAAEELVQDDRLLGDRPAPHPMPTEHDDSLYSTVGPSWANDDAGQLKELSDSWEVGQQSLERKLSASGQSLITAEDFSWTTTHDQNRSYASGTFEPDRRGRTASKHHPARSLRSSQHESSPTMDQFLELLNLINHERAARKALQSRLQELKIEVAELRSRSPLTHPLRMHPVTPLPQAPPSPPPSSPDLRLSASFSGLIKHRLEKATRFAPSRPPSPISMHAAQVGRESGQTDRSTVSILTTKNPDGSQGQ